MFKLLFKYLQFPLIVHTMLADNFLRKTLILAQQICNVTLVPSLTLSLLTKTPNEASMYLKVFISFHHNITELFVPVLQSIVWDNHTLPAK